MEMKVESLPLLVSFGGKDAPSIPKELALPSSGTVVGENLLDLALHIDQNRSPLNEIKKGLAEKDRQIEDMKHEIEVLRKELENNKKCFGEELAKQNARHRKEVVDQRQEKDFYLFQAEQIIHELEEQHKRESSKALDKHKQYHRRQLAERDELHQQEFDEIENRHKKQRQKDINQFMNCLAETTRKQELKIEKLAPELQQSFSNKNKLEPENKSLQTQRDQLVEENKGLKEKVRIMAYQWPASENQLLEALQEYDKRILELKLQEGILKRQNMGQTKINRLVEKENKDLKDEICKL